MVANVSGLDTWKKEFAYKSADSGYRPVGSIALPLMRSLDHFLSSLLFAVCLGKVILIFCVTVIKK